MKVDTFFNELDTIVRAPEGVQKLRQVILQIAMRGRLVPQCSRDGDASALLDSLIIARQGVSKAKDAGQLNLQFSIRKEDKLPSLPPCWLWVRLGEVGRIVGGGTPRTALTEHFADEGIPWLTPADLYKRDNKFIGRGKRDLSEMGLKDSSARILPTGTVLFSSRAPIGYVAIAQNPLATNQGFKSVVPYVMGMNMYVYYFLRSAVKKIEREASGTTFKEISAKDMERIQMPLPPLSEQERIVAKLDQLMALCSDLEASISRSQQVRGRLAAAAINQLLTV